MATRLTRHKAAEMLRHGKVRGHDLTPAQVRLFQMVKHGGKPTLLGKKR